MQVIVLAGVRKSGEDEVKAPSSSTVSVTRVKDKGSKRIHEGSPGQIYLLLTFSGQLSFIQALLEKSELRTRHNEALTDSPPQPSLGWKSASTLKGLVSFGELSRCLIQQNYIFFSFPPEKNSSHLFSHCNFTECHDKTKPSKLRQHTKTSPKAVSSQTALIRNKKHPRGGYHTMQN